MVWKFEGIQPDRPGYIDYAKDFKIQSDECLRRLSIYLQDITLIQEKPKNWSHFFELLSPIVEKHDIILYFEEVQWLASYESDFFSRLKPFWDDLWRHNQNLKIIFCGSAPSFIVNQVLSDRALYNRNVESFHLQPFSLFEIKQFLGEDKIGAREAMLAQLCLGGIPEYLKKIQKSPSVLQGLADHSFLRNSFFVEEFDKIFISSLSESKYYKEIIRYLSDKKFSTRQEISQHLGNKSPGGSFTRIIDDLQKIGLIAAYTPVHAKTKSKLIRYQISDEYLNFFYRFIYPHMKEINRDKFSQNSLKALNKHSLTICLGFMFEKWVVKNEHLFAEIMRFDQIEYLSGAYFGRKTEAIEKGFQIDLIYI